MQCKFTRDGKYALVMKNNKTPALLDWKNGWSTVVECDSADDKILLYKNVFISDDNKTIVGASWQSVTIWDAETGKIKKKLQVREDTVLSGSGQTEVSLSYDIKSIALLADGKSLCISENVVVYSNSAQKILSEYYLGEVIDIETGERKAISKDILSFIAIPGSNDVIIGGKRDTTKFYFDTYYLCDGLTLTKKFMYPTPNIEFISLTNTGKELLYDTKAGGTLSIIDVNTGKELCKAFGEDGFGAPAALSSNKKYIMADGGSGFMMMYSVDRLCSTSSVVGQNYTSTDVAPIPSDGLIIIKDKDVNTLMPYQYKLIGVQGELFNIGILTTVIDNSTIQFDVSTLSNGRYTLTLQQSGRVFSYPFILTK